MLKGSPNPERNTNAALEEIASVLNTEGIESDIFRLGNGSIRDCIGCGGCAKGTGCAFTHDKANDFTRIAKEYDGFVFGTPVYYAHPIIHLLTLLSGSPTGRFFCLGRIKPRSSSECTGVFASPP